MSASFQNWTRKKEQPLAILILISTLAAEGGKNVSVLTYLTSTVFEPLSSVAENCFCSSGDCSECACSQNGRLCGPHCHHGFTLSCCSRCATIERRQTPDPATIVTFIRMARYLDNCECGGPSSATCPATSTY